MSTLRREGNFFPMEGKRKREREKTHREHRIKHVRMIRVLRFGREEWGHATKSERGEKTRGGGEIGRTEDTERSWGTRFELNE